MAGLYESLLGEPVTIFGNVATTPANAAYNNARIDALRQNVANAQAQLNQANGSNNTQSIQDRLYDYYMNEYRNTQPTSVSGVVRKELFGDSLYSKTAQQQAEAEAKKIAAWYGGDASAVSSAQNALTTAQNKLNAALARQEANRLAGEQAVQWGQAAQDAEQQGIAQAAKMYEAALQGEATRNAIMNNAIGTVGNFNFGGGR